VSERLRTWVSLGVIATSLAVIVTVLASSEPSPTDRVVALASRLKCPVCQSESINDSPAQLSRDLKQLITDRVAEGWTDQQILGFFVSTYGDEVLLDPPGGGRTALLWVLPALVGVIGLATIGTRVRRSTRTLTDEERHKVEDALREAGL
jgi:cytochrome c-type biogenesis protein CcmH